MSKEAGFTWKLGMFVTIGLLLFIATIYFIGKQQNLFGSTFHLKSKFKTVSGLKVGNNVRFSGINVGTVDDISLVNDTTVLVKFKINDDVKQFIKTDAHASIGSDGLMGDKVLTISPGSDSNNAVSDNDLIASTKAIEMEQIMKSVQTTIDNAGLITVELSQFTHNMNNKNGTLSKLLTDDALASSLKSTILNLENFTKKLNNKNGVLSKLTSDEKLGKSMDSTITGLNESVKAAKQNFLLKGYFNKKKKAEAKKQKKLKKEMQKENKENSVNEKITEPNKDTLKVK
ncbi:MAG: MCE family protein [Burkholderiales bacterium]|nr:MCE family protein [Flavobacterium sp.]